MFKQKSQKRHHKKSGFLQKTYSILENEEFNNVVSWNDDGIGFVIYDCEKFTEKVLPLYFRHSNFNSFIRQLNMYGFSKKRASRSENYYFHEKFRKQSKQSICEIQRRTQKKNIKKQHKNNKIESQFSIQLQSRNQTLRKKQNTQYDKICFNFYNLINVNQRIFNSQFLTISEIIKDLRSLRFSQIEGIEEIKSFITKNENIFNMLENYVTSHLQLNGQLLQKAKNQIKNSQKYIQSIALVETQQNLTNQNRGFEIFKPRQ